MPQHDISQNINAGLPTHDGLDDTGASEIIRRLVNNTPKDKQDGLVAALKQAIKDAPAVSGLVGNFADVQRGFGQVAAGESSNVEDGIEVNTTEPVREPGPDDNSLAKAIEAKRSTDQAAEVGKLTTKASTTTK